MIWLKKSIKGRVVGCKCLMMRISYRKYAHSTLLEYYNKKKLEVKNEKIHIFNNNNLIIK